MEMGTLQRESCGPWQTPNEGSLYLSPLYRVGTQSPPAPLGAHGRTHYLPDDEELDRSAGDVCFMLARKDVGRGSFSAWTEKQDYCLNIEGLCHPVNVLAGEERYPRWLGHKLRSLLRGCAIYGWRRAPCVVSSPT